MYQPGLKEAKDYKKLQIMSQDLLESLSWIMHYNGTYIQFWKNAGTKFISLLPRWSPNSFLKLPLQCINIALTLPYLLIHLNRLKRSLSASKLTLPYRGTRNMMKMLYTMYTCKIKNDVMWWKLYLHWQRLNRDTSTWGCPNVMKSQWE